MARATSSLPESKLHINYLELKGVCPTVENPDLMLQEAGDSQGPTHFRPCDFDSRETIQARPDHPNRIVSPSRGLPVDIHQVAPSSSRPVCK